MSSRSQKYANIRTYSQLEKERERLDILIGIAEESLAADLQVAREKYSPSNILAIARNRILVCVTPLTSGFTLGMKAVTAIFSRWKKKKQRRRQEEECTCGCQHR